MDFGEAKYILSGSLNTRVLIINSERHDGYTFKFCKKTETKYWCTSCKALGKSRTITVRNGTFSDV
jgi:hypothetical protein